MAVPWSTERPPARTAHKKVLVEGRYLAMKISSDDTLRRMLLSVKGPKLTMPAKKPVR